MRYELHRVWVVEGNVKDGTSHIYDRRVFYVDEDSWHIAAADLYDARGEIWRIMEGHTIMAYDQPNPEPVMDASYDLQSNRYLMLSLSNEFDPVKYNVDFDGGYFNPRNVQREATR